MRNISFMLTQQQVKDRTKTVTRRIGWWTLKPGDLLCGVEKGMGLKRGEQVKRLATVRVVSVRQEPLSAMTGDPVYGRQECALEGFGDDPELQNPDQFVQFFCRSHRHCSGDTIVNRIEFEYVDAGAEITERQRT